MSSVPLGSPRPPCYGKRLRATIGLILLALPLAAAACGNAPPEPPGASEGRPVTAPPHAAPPLQAPTCGSDGWTTYAHDPARTSASAGCLVGPLRLAWSFSPQWVKGTPSRATRTIVTSDAVYVTGGIGPTPTVWRLDPASGAIAWTYVTMADSTRDNWPTLDGEKLLLVDDGVYSVDTATGHGHRGELDAWGESLTDGERLYAENDQYWDGYGLYVSAFDLEARLLWRRDYDALIRFFTAPDLGGLAMDGGRLVHAAQHGPLRSTALTAFDPVSGSRIWRASVSPQSAPSIADGRVFGIERWKGEKVDRLVARTLSDGVLGWARELPDARGPAPLLAAGLVVVHARDGVAAFDRASGVLAWSAPLPRTSPAIQSATTMAAATGSGTLVVVSGSKVHLLRLVDGGETWSGDAAAHAKRVEGPVVTGMTLYLMADGAVMRLDGAEPERTAGPAGREATLLSAAGR